MEIPLPPYLTPLLPPLELVYRCGLRFAAARHAWNVRRGEWPRRLPVPVVSVGNISAGGTGKTPVVEALAREWLRRGGHPGILSRGYRGGLDGNDEFHVLARRLPGVPHRQDPDRHRAGMTLLRERPEIDLIILDDGFQHRRLHRDLDLVLLDATRPLGFGHCLPRGLLREPWTALSRADAVLITRQESASAQKVAILRSFLRERFLVPIFSGALHVAGMRTPHGSHSEIPSGMRWAAFAGIGNPEVFFRNLREQGMEVVATRNLSDHYAFTERDLNSLLEWGRNERADALVCTEKDGVKLERLPAFVSAKPPIYQLRILYDLGSPHPLDLLRPAAE